MGKIKSRRHLLIRLSFNSLLLTPLEQEFLELLIALVIPFAAFASLLFSLR